MRYRLLAAVVTMTAGLIATPAAAATCPDLAPIQLAADHWIAGNPTFGDSTWFNALFIKGDIDAYRLTGNRKYLTYATGWASHNKWLLPTHAPNDDGPEASQEYIDLFELDPTHPARDIADAHAYVTRQTAAIESGKQSNMTYVDAVELGALSAFAHFGVVERNASDLDAMAKLFAFPESHIYDSKNSLWWRDSRWAGTTTHWSRGNGWIVLSLTNTIAALPATDPHRAHYIALLQAMFAKLRATQQPGGYWTANIDHPSDFPAPESSGTSFFTYGMAKSIQAGYLDAATYTPVVRAAWQWLRTTALHADGVVGYVQGPSSQPSQHQPISPNATTNYGVGAFLLAGVQASKFTPGC
jgi:rhamnogalacturonyl hydrolase YesR